MLAFAHQQGVSEVWVTAHHGLDAVFVFQFFEVGVENILRHVTQFTGVSGVQVQVKMVETASAQLSSFQASESAVACLNFDTVK